jgi:hypothetical protein
VKSGFQAESCQELDKIRRQTTWSILRLLIKRRL